MGLDAYLGVLPDCERVRVIMSVCTRKRKTREAQAKESMPKINADAAKKSGTTRAEKYMYVSL